MDFFWAALSALVAFIAFAAGKHAWRAPDRWAEKGKYDGGFGLSVEKASNPHGFMVLGALVRLWAILAFLFSVAGIGTALFWIGNSF